MLVVNCLRRFKTFLVA